MDVHEFSVRSQMVVWGHTQCGRTPIWFLFVSCQLPYLLHSGSMSISPVRKLTLCRCQSGFHWNAILQMGFVKMSFSNRATHHNAISSIYSQSNEFCPVFLDELTKIRHARSLSLSRWAVAAVSNAAPLLNSGHPHQEGWDQRRCAPTARHRTLPMRTAGGRAPWGYSRTSMMRLVACNGAGGGHCCLRRLRWRWRRPLVRELGEDTGMEAGKGRWYGRRCRSLSCSPLFLPQSMAGAISSIEVAKEGKIKQMN